MSVFLHQLAFALAVAALLAASLRLTARTGARGLVLVLAAAPVLGTAIVLLWLALGVVGLAASSVACLVAAVATWVVVRVLVRAPDNSLVDDAFAWARSQPVAVVVGVAALTGAAVALLAWCLRYPAIGADGWLYHLPESIAWLHGAQPGSVVQSFYGLPVGNYPLADELIQGWGFALSRSFAPATLLMMWSLALLVTGGWVGLRALAVPPPARTLAVAAVAGGPLALGAVNFASTDLPAAAWLVVCAALVACAVRERPALIVPAILAAGLAIGTKTTALPLSLAAVAVGLFALRRRLAPLARPLGAALIAAAVVGGVWYVRNLVVHGSPFWPLVAAPWGDPVPEVIKRFDASLLDRPGFTLSGNLGEYTAPLAGGVVLLLGVVLCALLVRTRAVLAAAGVALVSFVLWANAPLTGRSSDPFFASIAPGTTRYLLPGLCAAALVLALAARDRGAGGRIATALLAGAAAWSIIETASRGFPTLPGVGTLVVGAAAGIVVALSLRASPVRIPSPAIAIGLILLAAIVLKPAADGFVGRFARTVPAYAPALAAFDAHPAYANTSAPIAMAPVTFAPLAGNRLQHAIELMPTDISCAEVRQRTRDGLVVIVSSVSEFATGVYFNAGKCLAGRKPAFQAAGFTAYADR